MGWWSNAWDNVKSAGSAVGNAIADTTVHVAARVADTAVNVVNTAADITTSAVNNTSNFVGGGDLIAEGDLIEKPEALKEIIAVQDEAIGAAITATGEVIGKGVDIVKTNIAITAGTVLGETATEALGWEEANTYAKVRNEALGAAWEWTSETAAPAVGNFAAGTVGWAVTLTPGLSHAAGALETYSGVDVFGINDKQQSVANFGQFVVDDPGRALAVMGQGAVNAVSTTVGLVGDVARNAVGLTIDVAHNVVWNNTLRHVANGVYSLGAEEGEGAYFEGTDFFAATKGLNGGGGLENVMSWTIGMEDTFTFIEPIRDVIPVDGRETIIDENGNEIANPNFQKEVPEPPEGEEFPPYVVGMENPNANYERVLLYGTQAIVEVPVFAAATTFTGGAAASVWAVKYGGKGLQTVSAIRRADMVGDALRLTTKATTLADKAGDARGITNSVNRWRSTRAMNRAEGIMDGTRLGTRGDDMAQGLRRTFMRADDVREAVTKSDMLEYLAKYTETVQKADDAIKRLVAQGASPAKIDKAKDALNVAQEALEKARVSVNGLADDAIKVTAEEALTASRTLENLTTSERMMRGWELGSYRGYRWGDPFRSPKMEAAGVGFSFGSGVYANTVNNRASQHELDTMDENTIEANQDLQHAGDALDALLEELGEEPMNNNSNDLPPINNLVPEENSVPQNGLRNQFQGTPDNDGASLWRPFSEGDTTQANMFNNRSSGLVIPIDGSAFNVEVSEEAANTLRSAIAK